MATLACLEAGGEDRAADGEQDQPMSGNEDTESNNTHSDAPPPSPTCGPDNSPTDANPDTCGPDQPTHRTDTATGNKNGEAHPSWAPGDVDWDGYRMRALQPRKDRVESATLGTDPSCCQVVGCLNPLRDLKNYFKRYRICEYHWQLSALLIDGIEQRFCQQCGRFEPLHQFDGARRTCRIRLAKHNQRRRTARAQASKRRLAAAAATEAAAAGDDAPPAGRAAAADATSSPNATSTSSASHQSDPALPPPRKKRATPRAPGPSPPAKAPRAAGAPAHSPHPAAGARSTPYEPRRSTSPTIELNLAPAPPLNTGPSSLHLHPSSYTNGALVHSTRFPPDRGHHPSSTLPPGSYASRPSHALAYHPPSHPLHAARAGHGPPGSTRQPYLVHPPGHGPPSGHHPHHPSALVGPQGQRHILTAPNGGPSSVYPMPLPPGHGGLPPQYEYETILAVPIAGSDGYTYYPVAVDHDSMPRTHSHHPHALQHAPPPHQHHSGPPRAPPPGTANPPPMPSHAPPKPAPMHAPGAPAPGAHPSISAHEPPPAAGPPQRPPHSSTPPSYEAMEHMISFSLKIFNCIPSKLPGQLREHLEVLVKEAIVEGAIRPGCVHLTVDAFAPRTTPPPSAAELAARLLPTHPFWSQVDVLVQASDGHCLLQQGTPHVAPLQAALGPPAAAPPPSLDTLAPLCIHDPASQPISLTWRSHAPSTNPARIFCRSGGQYLTPMGVPAPAPALQGQHSTVQFHTPAPPEGAVMVKVEVARELLVSETKVLLVVDSPEMAAEICQLELPHLAALRDSVLPDLGRTLELGNHAAALQRAAAAAPRRAFTQRELRSSRAAAQQLLRLCAALGWHHVAAALAPVAALGDAALEAIASTSGCCAGAEVLGEGVRRGDVAAPAAAAAGWAALEAAPRLPAGSMPQCVAERPGCGGGHAARLAGAGRCGVASAAAAGAGPPPAATTPSVAHVAACPGPPATSPSGAAQQTGTWPWADLAAAAGALAQRTGTWPWADLAATASALARCGFASHRLLAAGCPRALPLLQ